ncbi:hypothetical protein F2P56_020690, partial [Juglans regia]
MRSTSTGNLPVSIGLKDGGCPYGTVPIMRIDEDSLARAKMNTKMYLMSNIIDDDQEPGHHYAILQTKPDLTRKIEGIQASFSAFNAQGVDGSQHSSFRMMLSNGLDSIKTGLTVNPLLFQDNKTRLFTHVVIPLGWPVDLISVVGGKQYAIKLQVLKEYIGRGPNTTDFVWTLRFELKNDILGLWPTKVFSKLSEFGNYADWGGEVYSPLDQPSPAMGTGIRPLRHQWSTSYSAHSHFVALAYHEADLQSKFESPNETEVYESDPKLYSILDIGHRDKLIFGDYLIIYDGPGGIQS